MLIAYWAAKGGSGTTVLAASHALCAARTAATIVVDLDGDLPGALGVDEPPTGVSDWLAAGRGVPADAFERIGIDIAPNLRLVGRGAGPLPRARAAVLAALLSTMPRTVIVDCGTRPAAVARTVARSATRSVLVTRPCYLAVRRQMDLRLAPTEVALVHEPQRVLGAGDIAAAVGAPVRLQITTDPGVARAVDAGLLLGRLPRSMARPLQRAIDAAEPPDSGGHA